LQYNTTRGDGAEIAAHYDKRMPVVEPDILNFWRRRQRERERERERKRSTDTSVIW